MRTAPCKAPFAAPSVVTAAALAIMGHLLLTSGTARAAGPTISQTLVVGTNQTGQIVTTPGVRIGGDSEEPGYVGKAGQTYIINDVVFTDRASTLAALRAARTQADLDRIAESIEDAILAGQVDATLGVALMVLVDEAAADL